MKAAWKRLPLAVLDLVYPPLCLSCRAPVGSGGGFCADCWKDLRFLDGPGLRLLRSAFRG